MSFSSVGQVFDLIAFEKHLETLDLSWADSVTIHHTASPSLAMRPKGWTIQHMRNIQDFYQRVLKWTRGPHLFTDEDQIFGMSPLTERGVHAVSFNAHSIGIEMLGDYDTESPLEGRGKEVLDLTAAAAALILKKLGKEPTDQTVKFHRDDPKTSKSCPGKKVSKGPFVAKVKALYDLGEVKAFPPIENTIEQRLKAIEDKLGITH